MFNVLGCEMRENYLFIVVVGDLGSERLQSDEISGRQKKRLGLRFMAAPPGHQLGMRSLFDFQLPLPLFAPPPLVILFISSNYLFED